MISNSGTSTLGLYDLKRQIDAFGGVDYFRPNLAGGYLKNARVMLANGDIVKSTVSNNTVNPNVDMTGWELPQARDVFDASGLSQQEINNNGFVLVDSRMLGLVGGIEGDQSAAVTACNNYVNAIPVNKDTPIVLRLPKGLVRSSTGFAFDRQTILFAEGDSVFDYTGTGYAVRLGKLGVTDYTEGFRTFGIKGVCFTGADNCKHGIYVSQYVLAPTLESVKFNDFGNPADVNSYCVFFQAHNWDIYVRNCKGDWVTKNHINLIKTNGVTLEGVSDNGNSRLNMLDSFYFSGGNDAGGIGVHIDCVKGRIIGGGFQGFKHQVELGRNAQNLEINGTYFESVYANCESIIKVGVDGITSKHVMSDLNLSNIYANLHNENNEYGNTDVKFLITSPNISINNLILTNIKTANGVKYPLLNLQQFDGQSVDCGNISHNNALLHNIRDDQMVVINPEHNYIPNSDLKIWQRGGEFTFVDNTTRIADGFSLLGDGNTGNIKVYHEPLAASYGFTSTAGGLMRLVREVASNGTYNTMRFRVDGIDVLAGQLAVFSFSAKAFNDMTLNATFVQDYGSGDIVYTSLGSFDLKASAVASNYAKAIPIPSLNRSYSKGSGARTYIDIGLPLTPFGVDITCFLLTAGTIRKGWYSKDYIKELEYAKKFYQFGWYTAIQDQTRIQLPLIPQMRYSPTSKVHINYQDGASNYDAAIILSEIDRIVFSLNARSQDVSATWTADAEL